MTHSEFIKTLPFHEINISGRAVEANVVHNCKYTSTMLIKCNGRMKEMFEDREFIRGLGQHLTEQRALHEASLPIPDGNR